MPFQKILKNLYLGDQFSLIKLTNPKELKISNTFYDILSYQTQEEILLKNDYFVLTKNKLAVKMYDTHSVTDFNDYLFASAVKFIKENIQNHQIYTHCHLGVSRSASTIFVYLVTQNLIQAKTFSEALGIFLDDYYPYMKVNFGVYNYLKNNFPYINVKKLSQQKWEEF